MKRDGEGVGTRQARPAVAATPVSAPGAVWRIIVLSHRAPAFRTLMFALPGDREREADDRQTNRDSCQNADDKGAVFVTHGHEQRRQPHFQVAKTFCIFYTRTNGVSLIKTCRDLFAEAWQLAGSLGNWLGHCRGACGRLAGVRRSDLAFAFGLSGPANMPATAGFLTTTRNDES